MRSGVIGEVQADSSTETTAVSGTLERIDRAHDAWWLIPQAGRLALTTTKLPLP